MKDYTKQVALYSVTHFLIDFACVYLVYRTILSDGAVSGVTLTAIYIFCAFALQLPLGPLVDKLDRNAQVAALGCILVIFAYILFAFSAGEREAAMPSAEGIAAEQIVGIMISGLGNALFHLGGGIEVLNISKQKSGLLGVFISPGAFGVFFGIMLSRNNLLWLSALMVVALLFAAAAIILCRTDMQKRGLATQNAHFGISIRGYLPTVSILAVCGFFAAVVLRSWVGLSFDPEWKAEPTLAVVLVCATVGGKAVGGFLADKLGARKMVILSLSAATALFLFADTPAAGIVAIFCFNMTMPITLWAMARVFANAKGFAFGLLCFGLFLGAVPSYLIYPIKFADTPYWVFASVAAVSLAVLIAALSKRVISGQTDKRKGIT
jgi:FSR family fosmidomycin resistance protein-like MFS transporter